MTYIEQLQNDKILLLEFFNAYETLEAKHYVLENTAYKGDALQAVDAAHASLAAVRTKVYEMLGRATTEKKATKKEKVNV